MSFELCPKCQEGHMRFYDTYSYKVAGYGYETVETWVYVACSRCDHMLRRMNSHTIGYAPVADDLKAKVKARKSESKPLRSL